MSEYTRYAVYYAPRPGPLAEFTAAWLGWDALTGSQAAHPLIAGLPRPIAEITQSPRKYGFHGTLKPPFALARSRDAEGLEAAVEGIGARTAPIQIEKLELAVIDGFVALVPKGECSALNDLAARLVTDLDGFRAPSCSDELQKRRKAPLSAHQDALLARWGYPYVLDEFRFHLTLTGRLPDDEARAVADILSPHLTPILPQPLVIKDLCIFGEAKSGNFHLLHRYRLCG